MTADLSQPSTKGGNKGEGPGKQKSQRAPETQKTFKKSRKCEKGEPRPSVSQREGSGVTGRLWLCCLTWQPPAKCDSVKVIPIEIQFPGHRANFKPSTATCD